MLAVMLTSCQPFPEDENGNAIGAPGEPTKKPGDSDYLERPEQWTTGKHINPGLAPIPDSRVFQVESRQRRSKEDSCTYWQSNTAKAKMISTVCQRVRRAKRLMN